jgi:hypothetical protein
MTLSEFEAHLDAQGATLARWGPAAAARASALLEASPMARQMHVQAQTLDRALDLALAVDLQSTAALRARILDELERPTAASRLLDWLSPEAGWLRPLVLALVPLCLGFVVGTGYPDRGGVSEDLIADVSLFAFAAYEEVADAQ